jgi:hypothetical protein
MPGIHEQEVKSLETATFEASGSYPSTFTNIGPAFVAPYDLTVVSVEVIVEANGSGGGYSEFDVVAGASGNAPATILSTKPRVPGNGGVWGRSGVTASSVAAVVNGTGNYAKGTIFSCNITSAGNQPPTTNPVSATVVMTYRRQ